MDSGKVPILACRVCGQETSHPVRRLVGQRTGCLRLTRFCTSCLSLAVESDYREDRAALLSDLEWNRRQIERNRELAQGLLGDLRRLLPGMRSVLEVGCGIGTFLSVAKEEYGLAVEGYDVNEEAIAWGNEHFGLKMNAGEWNASRPDAADLVVSISCLEHIAEPRPLLAEMASYAVRRRAAVFISVPMFNPRSWRYLEEGCEHDAGSPFFDNDVHVTLFSSLGLVEAMRQFGLPAFQVVKRKGWAGVLFSKAFPWRQRRALRSEADQHLHRWAKRARAEIESEECPSWIAPLKSKVVSSLADGVAPSLKARR